MGSFIRKPLLWGCGILIVLLIFGNIFGFGKTENSTEIIVFESSNENEEAETLSSEIETVEKTEEQQIVQSINLIVETEKPLVTENSTIMEIAQITEKPEEIEQPKQIALPKETSKPQMTEVPSISSTPQVPEKAEESTQVQVPEKAEHVCNTAVSLEEPSCLSAGKEFIYCTECKKIISEAELSPLGHSMKVAVWESATCQKAGFYNNICERCGLTESVTEAALSHVVEDVLIREGNCMEDTVIRHLCKTCGEQVEPDTRYTPQTHQWLEAEVDGEMVLYCEWCGITK